MLTDYILSIITFFPLLAIPLIVLVPKSKEQIIRWISLAVITVPLILSFYLYAIYNINSPIRPYSTDRPDLMFVEHLSWIKSFNIEYFLAVDGISMPMVLLTTIVSFVGVIGSWGINKSVKGYFVLYTILYVGMMGVFLALDFFLFYVFWEVMLLPMYFLIGIWGGQGKSTQQSNFSCIPC